jgi:hypothetical protein
MRRLDSHFYHRAACGSLPEIHKTTESGKVADSKWQTAPISLTNQIAHHIPPSQRKGFVSNVEEVAKQELMMRYNHAEIIIRPLCLATDTHTGPGTWTVNFLPDMEETY